MENNMEMAHRVVLTLANPADSKQIYVNVRFEPEPEDGEIPTSYILMGEIFDKILLPALEAPSEPNTDGPMAETGSIN